MLRRVTTTGTTNTNTTSTTTINTTTSTTNTKMSSETKLGFLKKKQIYHEVFLP